MENKKEIYESWAIIFCERIIRGLVVLPIEDEETFEKYLDCSPAFQAVQGLGGFKTLKSLDKNTIFGMSSFLLKSIMIHLDISASSQQQIQRAS